MANLIQKAKRKTPELTVIKWDGTEESVAELRPILASFECGVFYIGRDDWHHTLTPDESYRNWYYEPYLVINAGRRENRFEKDQYLVINPEASSLEPKVTIMSEEELRKTHELYETKEEEVADDNPSDDDQAEGSDYRAAEDLAGHGDGELRERDSLGGESGEPDHEDESNV